MCGPSTYKMPTVQNIVSYFSFLIASATLLRLKSIVRIIRILRIKQSFARFNQSVSAGGTKF